MARSASMLAGRPRSRLCSRVATEGNLLHNYRRKWGESVAITLRFRRAQNHRVRRVVATSVLKNLLKIYKLLPGLYQPYMAGLVGGYPQSSRVAPRPCQARRQFLSRSSAAQVQEEFRPSAWGRRPRRLNWKAILTVRPSMIAHRTSPRRCVYLTFALIRLSPRTRSGSIGACRFSVDFLWERRKSCGNPRKSSLSRLALFQNAGKKCQTGKNCPVVLIIKTIKTLK